MKDIIKKELKEHGLFYCLFFIMICIVDFIFGKFDIGYVFGYFIGIILIILVRIIVNYRSNKR